MQHWNYELDWALDWHWMRRRKRKRKEGAEEENEAAAVDVAERWPVKKVKVNIKEQNEIRIKCNRRVKMKKKGCIRSFGHTVSHNITQYPSIPLVM